ncbi:MAG: hypothetical protein Q7S80_01420, partial [bacterium]|nr:hypothetical protein [bacterium]
MSKKTKNRVTQTLIQGSFIFVFSALFLLLVFPSRVHAEGVYSVLASTSPDSFGGQVQQIWKQLLNVVNSLVVLVLIVVAFAEMLRININTYGVKKILPTLILAIIAANFSFMFCRLIIDVANVSITFVKCIGDPTGCSATLTTTTSQSPVLAGKAGLVQLPDFAWKSISESLLGSLMQNIILFIEAVLLLCLAFLFIVRNWVLYALVIFSPVMFMAMVLPQTKKYFNQWWTMLIQWAFMPLISFIFIALANRFAGVIPAAGGVLDTIMIPVFVAVCLYAAITMPFKLGGPVMQSFYKGTGAKWGVNKGGQQFREKVINKNLDYLKSKGYNKVLEQASKQGPIGALVRRGLKRNADIELEKRKTEGLINQGYREATVGGKYRQKVDENGNLMTDENGKPIYDFEATFGSIEQAEAWGKKLDDVDSLFGEKEWAEKFAKQRYYEKQARDKRAEFERAGGTREQAETELTAARKAADDGLPEIETALAEENITADEREKLERQRDTLNGRVGKAETTVLVANGGYSDAALRSAQYDMRMAATDLHLANFKNLSMAMAYRGDPNFMSNPQYAAVYQAMASATLLSKPLEKTANKAKGDFERESVALAVKLNEEIAGFQKAVATFAAATKELAEFEKKNSNWSTIGLDTDSSKEEQEIHLRGALLEEQKARADAIQIQTREGYNAQMEAIKRDPRYFADGQFKGIAAATLSGMVAIGRDGSFAQIEDARSLSQAYAIPGGLEYLFRDRSAKSFSEIVKNEIASEREKRTGLESARLLTGELRVFTEKWLSGQGNQLTAEQLWKVYAAFNNAQSVTR